MTKSLASLIGSLDLPTKPEWNEIQVTGVTEDSRNVERGSLFIAIEGLRRDGHDYIEEAISRGAAAIVAERDTPSKVPLITVSNPRRALAGLSAAFFGNPTQRLFTIGTTGTNGKTTVCHLVAQLLGKEKTAVVSTVANDWRGIRGVTTPSSPILQRLAGEALLGGKKNLVIEASSAGLALHRLDFVDFDVAVFTNLTHDHLDLHRTTESYLQAKLALFRSLEEEGYAIVNADDPMTSHFLAASRAQCITYGLDNEADLTAGSIDYGEHATSFSLFWKEERFPIEIRLPGEHNLYNALAAAAVGLAKGEDIDLIADRLGSAESVEGRFQFLRARSGACVVIDYAHSPDSLERMLAALRKSHPRVVAVFGCSGCSDRPKRPVMGATSGKMADLTIITTDNPKTEDPERILDEIEQGLKITGGDYLRIADRAEAVCKAVSSAKEGDAVLIAGKGHERYQIVDEDFVPYSDLEVLSEAGLIEP